MAAKHLEASEVQYSGVGAFHRVHQHLPSSSITYLYLSRMMERLEREHLREASGVRLCNELGGAVRCALGCENGTPTMKVVDTTQHATRRNGGQPPARKSA